MVEPNSQDVKIVLFLCSWEPHAAFQTLQDAAADIPAQIKMVRIPCTGRITKALLFKPFEMGADGVALVGCPSGACRYGPGSTTAQDNVADTRQILDLVGLGKNRLRWATFAGEQDGELLDFLAEFAGDVLEMGKTPVQSASEPEAPQDAAAGIKKIAADHDVFACQDCGKCTSACSLTLSGKDFSPRAIAAACVTGKLDDPAVQQGVWACLTCGLCFERCPSAVNFPEFIKDARSVLRQSGVKPFEAHGGFFQSLSRTMACPDLEVRHWDWLPEDIQTDPESKILYFGGCAPYYDVFFGRHLGVDTKKILQDSIRLLNFFDIEPAVLESERCCGHDLLWTGDRDNFEKLARLNVEAIHAKGIEEMVISCPEGYRTWTKDIPAAGIKLDFKVTHILELVEREVDKGAVSFKKVNKNITFQDPCRLSRHMEMAELPRKLLGRLNTAGFTEMANAKAGAICCGNCGWIECDACSKALQVKRLGQAEEAGAELLVTACPKCQIHLSCAMDDPFGLGGKKQMTDLTGLLAKTIYWE